MHTHLSSLDLCTLCQFIDGSVKDGLIHDIAESVANDGADCSKSEELELDTDTVVIGNGPAGIAISAMLNGWKPFYNSSNPHPNPEIHERLSQLGPNESLFSQDLSSLASLVQNELNNNLTPFAALYDSLVRPSPSDPNCQSCLEWRHFPAETVPHIVLGDSNIGGSWTGYQDEMTTVSISNWMDLPGYSLAMDFIGDPEFTQKRPNARTFKHYLLAYCLVMGIDHRFKPFTRVTQMQKLCHRQNGDEFWELGGINIINGEPFTLRCRNVVLACGQSQFPRLLGVSGELSCSSIVYDLSALKCAIADTNRENEEENAARPVVVIGDGISAADAVRYCLDRGYPVLHVIRRNDRQLKNVMLSRLSPSIYPEYSRVYQLMMGRTHEAGYRQLTDTNVLAINDDDSQHQLLTLETPNGIIQEQFRCLCICIGRRSDLPLFQSSTEFQFSTNYQSTADSSLFVIGALAGDHFVRYLVGGALCVGQKLAVAQKERRKTQQQWKATRMNDRFRCCIAFRPTNCQNGNKSITIATGKQQQHRAIGGIPRTNSATPLLQLASTTASGPLVFAAANYDPWKSSTKTPQPTLLNRASSTMQLSSVTAVM